MKPGNGKNFHFLMERNHTNLINGVFNPFLGVSSNLSLAQGKTKQKWIFLGLMYLNKTKKSLIRNLAFRTLRTNECRSNKPNFEKSIILRYRQVLHSV